MAPARDQSGIHSLKDDAQRNICSVCGTIDVFIRGDSPSTRESYKCPQCNCSLRWRDQASVIVDEFGRGQVLSLDELVSSRRLNSTAIFEAALRGPFVRRFRGLPNYTQSYFRPGEPLGQISSAGVRNEDLTKLTFDEDSFDLVISSDVMEHLPEIDVAFAETLRVLRVGGVHVFSIPNDFPFPDRTEQRVRIEGGNEVNIKPARYHSSGDGTKCLVYTDYGADLTDLIHSLGGRLSVVRRSSVQEHCHTNATFVMRKVAHVGRRRPVSMLQSSAAQDEDSSIASATVPRQNNSSPPFSMECPICQGTEFKAFNGRPNARCVKCWSVERTRLMSLVLERMGIFESEKRVLHLAPELGLAQKFLKSCGDLYHPADLDVSRYKSKLLNVRKLDLCTDLSGIPDNSYDVVIHSHVLEHLPCDISMVLREMDRILAPGGHHFMSVPIRGQRSTENISSQLTTVDRLIQFGQEDHMRIFGALDLPVLLSEVWGAGDYAIKPMQLFERDTLRRAAIPSVAWQGVTSHTVFHYRKDGGSPAENYASTAPREDKRDDSPLPQLTPAITIRQSGSGGDSARASQSSTTENSSSAQPIFHGLTELCRDNPWPVYPCEQHEPFHLALDCNGDGGREIVIRQIIEKDVRLMVEVGCFLGGSSLHWLNAKPDLFLISVDPWDGNWARYIEDMLVNPSMSRHVEHLSDAEVRRIAGLLREYGNYAVAVNNLRAFRNRFCPVRRFSPEALHYLSSRNIPLELIYIDAFKLRADLDVAHSLFPNAILCGDDWLWPDETGRLVMQEAVKEFAHEHKFEIEAKRQSWVLHRS